MKLPKILPKSINATPVEIANLRLADFTAEASPFAQLGYKPDLCRAYLEFDICQSMPAFAGPVQAGNFIGYFAETVAASHGSLLHQQFNLRHMLKAYAPKPKPGEQPAIARDRIVGCVVATHFPKAPMNGWLSAKNEKGGTACIRACAVVFKLAEGMAKLLGEHLTSRVQQSVSIECTTAHDNIGIWIPSRRELMPVLEPTEEVMMNAIQLKDAQGVEYPGLPHIGKLNGEQLIVIYGAGGKPIQFQGVGLTARPAEKTAKIVSVSAERVKSATFTRDDGELVAMAAEEVGETLVGQTVKFSTGRVGRIDAVTCEGLAKLGGLHLKATTEDPVLRIIVGRDVVLHRLSSVAEKLK